MARKYPLHIRVAELRKSRGWTQDHLAQRAGVSTKTVARLETGGTSPSPRTQAAIADAFGLTVQRLLYDAVVVNSEGEPRTYIHEYHHRGKCIALKSSSEPFIDPSEGDELYAEFLGSESLWWRITKRRHIKFAAGLNLETLILECEPLDASATTAVSSNTAVVVAVNRLLLQMVEHDVPEVRFDASDYRDLAVAKEPNFGAPVGFDDIVLRLMLMAALNPTVSSEGTSGEIVMRVSKSNARKFRLVVAPNNKEVELRLA